VPVARRTHQITHVFLFAIRNSRYFFRRTDCLTYVTVPKIDEKTASLENSEHQNAKTSAMVYTQITIKRNIQC
jgi:hypothetical protein